MRQASWAKIVLCASGVVSSNASMITGAKDGAPPSAQQDPYTVNLTPPTVQHIGNSFDSVFPALLTLRSEYNDSTNWLFRNGGNDSAGTFDILQYSAWIADDDGGANFSMVYDDGVAAPADNYEFVQIERYHNWGTGRDGDGTRVDAKYGNFPFYGAYTPDDLPTDTIGDYVFHTGTNNVFDDNANYPSTTKIQDPAKAGKIPGGDLLFADQPYCPLSCADTDGYAYAIFDLFLVTYNWNGKLGSKAGGDIQIYDGIRWGVEITKAPTVFNNPGSLPEPATYWLIGGGLIAIACRMRKTG